MEIKLPVSIGEAIDKLTILDIKSNKITDSRKLDVLKEYEILHTTLNPCIHKYQDLYDSMRKINMIIWNQMEILRDGSLNDTDYTKLCRDCIKSNDIRFRVKNKINLISNSSLKEQKSYKINRLLIELNCNENCFFLFVKPIKYFSFIYDEIIILSSNNLCNISDRFDYDNTIKYNIELTDFTVTHTYTFNDSVYTKDKIYDIMSITDEIIQLI
uniref:Uncharacterized protein n=1 Tax=viral metagenome TaxID=1070528 RepID=A0A6C0J7D2_9ZZZZ